MALNGRIAKTSLYYRRWAMNARRSWLLEKHLRSIYRSTRRDLEASWPAVLRINRQICEEGARFIYHRKCSIMNIRQGTISIGSYFCDVETQTDVDPDLGSMLFRRISRIDLSIHPPEHCRIFNSLDCTHAKCYQRLIKSMKHTAQVLATLPQLVELGVHFKATEKAETIGSQTLSGALLHAIDPRLIPIFEPLSELRNLEFVHFPVGYSIKKRVRSEIRRLGGWIETEGK